MSAGFVHEGELWIVADNIDEPGQLVFDPRQTGRGAWTGGEDFIAMLSERLELSERMETNGVDPTGDLHVGRARITVEVLEHDAQLTLGEGT